MSLKNPESHVCSIYSPETVSEVFNKIERTKEGCAFFTFPNTPIKCPGAPQKIAYLADDYWRKVINFYFSRLLRNKIIFLILLLKAKLFPLFHLF